VPVLILLVSQLNLEQFGLLQSHRGLLHRLGRLPPRLREDLLDLLLALSAWLAGAGAGIILAGRLPPHLQHGIQEGLLDPAVIGGAHRPQVELEELRVRLGRRQRGKRAC